MKVRIHGARGSHPISGREYSYFGGCTSCVEVLNGSDRLILDAGTGILMMNRQELEQADVIHILLTHLHMDHIQGLGFFKPLFESEKVVHIWGPGHDDDDLRQRLNKFLSPPLFPVSLRDTQCELKIQAFTDGDLHIGTFDIHHEYVIHPGPTVGFRVEQGSKSVVYIPDHEPVLGQAELPLNNDWVSGFDLAHGSDLLIHDAQYQLDEYMTKIGWGHCSMHHASELSFRAGVKHLLMFHHDPAHTDQVKHQMFETFLNTHQYNFKISLAVQGMEIEV